MVKMLLCSVLKRIPKTVFTMNHNFSMFARPQPFLPLKNARTYKKQLNKFVRGQTVADYKIVDNVPEPFELIYRSTMNKYLLILQVVTIGTVGLAALVFCITAGDVDSREPFEGWSPTSRTTENERYFYMTSLIAFALVAQFTVTKIPLRIYKHPKASKYSMFLPANLPTSRTRFDFQRGQVMLPDESPSIIPWKRNTYAIHSGTETKSVIMFDQYFRRPADLYIMLGEQKDPDVSDDK